MTDAPENPFTAVIASYAEQAKDMRETAEDFRGMGFAEVANGFLMAAIRLEGLVKLLMAMPVEEETEN